MSEQNRVPGGSTKRPWTIILASSGTAVLCLLQKQIQGALHFSDGICHISHAFIRIYGWAFRTFDRRRAVRAIHGGAHRVYGLENAGCRYWVAREVAAAAGVFFAATIRRSANNWFNAGTSSPRTNQALTTRGCAHVSRRGAQQRAVTNQAGIAF
jgi:hypothetical protein